MVGIKESEIEVIKSGKGKEESVAMDTPDRSKTQIATPISNSEDSPVFNFLNNLSPIMAAKSVPVTQNMNALNFASMPSVFTSPHVSSLKELRFLRRHQVSDSWKPEFSSYSESKTTTDAGIMYTVCNGNEQQKIVYPENSFDGVSVEKPLESSKPTVGIVQNSNYDCSSPVCQTNTSCYSEILPFSKFAANSREVVPFDQLVRGSGLYGNEACTAEQSPGNVSGGATCCDWESISDVTDLLTFDSPLDVDTSKRYHDPATGYYNDITNDLQNVQPLRSVGSEYNETNNPSTQPGEGSYREELAEMQDILADSSLTSCIDSNFEQKTNMEPTSHLYHGVRRRCLVFEISGAPRKQLGENSSLISPIFTPSGGETPAFEKQLVPMRTKKNSKCNLPGIGLHLNALATNLKEYKCVTQNASVSGRTGISPGSITNFHSSKAGQEQQNDSLAIISRDTDPGENEFLIMEDAGHSSVHIENEDMNQSSASRKRRRLEEAAEDESACKRCNCKKSKCLKLYCECFAAGVYCVEPCSCRECFNKPIHEETVLATRKQIESRNPLAFAPKVIRNSDSQAEAGDDSSKTPASARHKRGCNCKKSGCLKKYCECYQGGVGCSVNCRCEGCKNAFGRKDGSTCIGPETELEENEIDTMEKSVKNRGSHKAAIQTNEDNTESGPQATPSQFKRPSVHPSFSSNKPPRSSTSIIGTSSLLPIKGLIGRTQFLLPPPNDKNFETVIEDEMPEILQGKGSPLAGVKSSSPNSKRVSPPHSNFGTSPNRRNSRKLILQSIPSFPCLTPKR